MLSRDADALERILSSREGFGHREHLELAWTYLRMHPLEDAERAMGAAIRHLANIHGAADRYHETLTRAWVRLVAVHRDGGDAGSFDKFIAANPGLLNRALLDGHYSRERLWGESARREWVAPDLAELPTHV